MFKFYSGLPQIATFCINKKLIPRISSTRVMMVCSWIMLMIFWSMKSIINFTVYIAYSWTFCSTVYRLRFAVQWIHTTFHTLRPNVPDHNLQQQLGLSHSLLVSAAPGHFAWSHQWHQICTAERQPLVGGRQGRWQQQWPGWACDFDSCCLVPTQGCWLVLQCTL